MYFWTILVFLCIFSVFIERCLSSWGKKLVVFMVIFSLFFISAFRYMIGWDYQSYMRMFYIADYDFLLVEPTFNFICLFFRNFGFDFQIIFFVYSFLTFIFLVFGIKRYANVQDKYLYYLIILNLFCTQQLYWSSFSEIRQILSVVIVYNASFFIIRRKFLKFLTFVFLATLFHYSAILFSPLYWILNIDYKRSRIVFFLSFIGICAIFNVLPNILLFFQDYLGEYAKYIIYEESPGFSSGITKIIYLFIFIYLTVKFNRVERKLNVLLNGYCMLLFFLFLCDFSAPIYRMKQYFDVFYITIIAEMICEYKKRWMYILLFLHAILFLYGLLRIPEQSNAVLHPYFSANNIEYNFNFKLLQ